MIDLTMGLVQPWRGQSLDAVRVGYMLSLMLGRTTTTTWAAGELLRSGFTQQAAMLNRSLFEDMADAHWMTVDPDSADERFPLHGTHADMLMTDALRKYPSLLGADEDPLEDYDAAEKKRLDAMFGRYGHKSWTGLTTTQRVDAIKHLFQGGERRALEFMDDVVHRANNRTLHVSGPGLVALVSESTRERFGVKIGPDPNRAALANHAYATFWMYTQTASLVLDHFSFPHDDCDRFAAAYLEHRMAYYKFPPEPRA